MREWKRSASKESRRLLAEARRDRRLVRQARHRENEARETALRAALARRPESPTGLVDRLLGAPRTAAVRTEKAREAKLCEAKQRQLQRSQEGDEVLPLTVHGRSGRRRRT